MKALRTLVICCVALGLFVLLSGQRDLILGHIAMADTEKTYLLGKREGDDFTPAGRLRFDDSGMPVLSDADGAQDTDALRAALDEILAREFLTVDGRIESEDANGNTTIDLISSQLPKGATGYSDAVLTVLGSDFDYTIIHE